ncbi:hypothetical protein St703_08090 [Sporolactobacillus terrae]|uniref:Bacterial Pleckstrin homology domain-containing protein n=1 Tax=Sporolactobacillus terrae TaxID=269673 RepID=A0A5K7WWQ4_9BACL|nr:hypothetical protein St703_08090 [Sporolactobacillus terrae]
MMLSSVYFREVQKMKQWWLWIVVLGISGLIWYGFISRIFFNKPFGTNPMPNAMMIVFFFIFGCVFPIFFAQVRLTCEVRKDGLYVCFFPFHLRPRCFGWNAISSYRIIDDQPMSRFGGWGIRFNLRGGKAYTVSGTQAIELVLNSGQIVVIGSSNAAKLKNSMDFAHRM